MKNLVSKIIMAACISSVAILSTAKASVAQVNMDFLTEVAESCQKDVFSEEYYQQMRYETGKIPSEERANSYLSQCIQWRYFYLLVVSRLPWLVSTEEMIPGYFGAVAVSQIAWDMSLGKADVDYPLQYSSFIDCLVSKDSNSKECSDRRSLSALYRESVKFNLAYLCPSCYVAYNNDPSAKKMMAAFIEWFVKLEKPQKKELTSFLNNEQAENLNSHNQMRYEGYEAWMEYTAIRKRTVEEEKERRRRELLGE